MPLGFLRLLSDSVTKAKTWTGETRSTSSTQDPRKRLDTAICWLNGAWPYPSKGGLQCLLWEPD